MSFKFSTELRVRLPETDALGIVYHGNFYTYFDVARMDYVRNLGLMEFLLSPSGANVLVHASADFRSPARFDDILVVEARLSAIGETSFTFLFRVMHRKEERLVAEGTSVHVAIDPKTWARVPVPEEFRRVVRLFEGADLVER